MLDPKYVVTHKYIGLDYVLDTDSISLSIYLSCSISKFSDARNGSFSVLAEGFTITQLNKVKIKPAA